MEGKNGNQKWKPVSTEWRESKYEAVGANGAKVVIVKGKQYDRIAKAGGKNPLARLIDSFQVYYELQRKIAELQDQVSNLTLQLEETKKKSQRHWDGECEARRDMAFLTVRFKDREKKLKELEQLGIINCFNDIVVEPVYGDDGKVSYYKKKK